MADGAQRSISDTPATEPALLAKMRRRRVLMLLGPMVVVIAGAYTYLSGGRYVSTDNAYVKMDKLAITSELSGSVAAIDVHENERVRVGQPLFRFDPEPYRIALSAAKAQLATARTEIANLQAVYQQNLAQIEQIKGEVAYFEAAFNRQSELSKRNIASQAAFDLAKRDLSAAQQRILAAQHQARATLAQLGGVADGKAEEHPRVQTMMALVEKTSRDLDRSVVRAAFDGTVTNVNALQVGSYLQPGQNTFSLVNTDKVWVEAFFKETDLTHVKAGNEATVGFDTYPDFAFPGRAVSISPASGAEFSILPPQNASGNWVKTVQRIPLRLEIVVPADAPALMAGMSATVRIDTKHRREFGRLLAGFAR